MIYYILKLTPGYFITVTEEILITRNTDKIQKFSRIGDAMKAAVLVNTSLGKALCKVERILQ